MACPTCSTCNSKRPCGCEDHALTTGTPCETGTPNCPTPDPCAETFSDECIVHTANTIVDINVQRGDRLDDILQRLTLLITNPGCILPGSTCLSVLGLQSTNVTPTTITIVWQPSTTATQYIVEYKLSSAMSWTLMAPTPLSAFPTNTIGGLVAGSEYDIRVAAICPSGTCYSVTIRLETLTA